MRRREFITLAGGAVAAWPLAAFGKAQRIAIVLPSGPVSIMTDTSGDPFFQALLNELRRLGYVEAQNLLIERYSGEGRAADYPDLARQIVSQNPDLVIAVSNNLVFDFKATTTTIPIVGVFGIPVEAGIVPNLARPSGNITGVSVDVGKEQWEKRFKCCGRWCRRLPDWDGSNREKYESSMGPKRDRNGWALPGLAPRLSIRQARLSIAACSPA
jgi:putative ABC transport system substrate-binding protein